MWTVEGLEGLEVVARTGRTLIFRGERRGTGQRLLARAIARDHWTPTRAECLDREYAAAHRVGDAIAVVPSERLGQGPSEVLLYPEPPGKLLAEHHAALRGVDEVLGFAIALCDQLESLHQLGMAHLGLTPVSIWFDPASGWLRLTDFSRARATESRVPLRLEDCATPQTLPYFAPEQTGRLRRVPDRRADLYAVGMLIYELLAGAPPFESDDVLEWMHWHLAVVPPRLHEVNPAVPAQLSAIVHRLLAKEPDDRYNTALGVVHDLARCRQQWRDRGAIAAFPLAEQDFAGHFELPDQLYGRQPQLDALRATAERGGGPRAVWLVGPAGSGKSGLARDFTRGLPWRTRVIAGKFEQYAQTVPYQAFAQAFRQLSRQVLSAEPPLASHPEALQRVADRSTSTLADLIPAFEAAFVGSTAPAGAVENRHRLEIGVGKVLAQVASRETPLVLVLDDLQWADDASLDLLRAVLTDAGLDHLLVIGCFRDDALPGSSLEQILAELDADGLSAERVALPPLSVDDLEAFARDVLQTSEGARDLAEYLARRTAGNPFDTRRLLRSLHEVGAIALDPRSPHWRWEPPTDGSDQPVDVVDLLSTKVEALPAATRQLVEIGMCIGNAFPLDTLAAVSDPGLDLLATLEPAVTARILDVDGTTYSFTHDRVQQAVAALTPESAVVAHHERIGWALYERAQREPDRYEALVFTAVGHLNRTLSPATDPETCRTLARLNLDACRSALASTAYAEAQRFAETALALLERSAPRGEGDRLRFEVCLDLARSRYLTGAFAPALEAIEACLGADLPFEDRVAAYAVLKDIRLSEGTREGYATAVQLGLEILGEVMPEGLASLGTPAVGDAEMGAVMDLVAGREPHELVDLPRMRDPVHAARLRLLVDVWEAAYYAGDDAVMHATVVQMVRCSLEHGNATESAMAYVLFGLMWLRRGDVDAAFAYGTLGLELNRKFGDERQLPKVTNLFCNYIQFLRQPFAASAELYEVSAQVGRDQGDFLFGLWAALFDVWTRLLSEDSLHTVYATSVRLQGFVEQTRDEKILRAYRLLQWTVAELMDAGRSEVDLGEREMLAYWEEHGFLPGATWHAILRGQVALVRGEPHRALELLTRPTLVRDPEIVMFPVSQLPFYRGAAAADVWRAEGAASAEGLRAVVAASLDELAPLAAQCPANFAWQAHLLEASLAEIDGEAWQAGEAYERAIEAAETHGPAFARALAHERAAVFWRAAGREAFAELYTERAVAAYARWGAVGKVVALHPLTAEAVATPGPGESDESRAFDLQSLVKAAEAVTGESHLGPLLDRTLWVAMENAGAERGVVLIKEGSQFAVALSATLGDRDGAAPLDARQGVPRAVVRLATRTRREVVSGDARVDPELRSDPYIAANGTRSVMCLPVSYQGEVTALLYLENDLAADVFSDLRLEALRVVASQLALTLEMTRLYRALVEEVEERRAAEAALAASELRLRNSHRFANVGVWDWDVRTGDLHWSEGIGRMFGDPNMEATYENFITGVHPDDRARVEAAIDACLDGSDYRVDHRVVYADGTVRWLSERGDLLRSDDGEPLRMMGVVQDITDRIEGEEERQRLTRHLQQAQKMEAIGQLTGGIAHDFNNILGITVGFAELAMAAADAGATEMIPDSLRQVLDSALRAKRLVEQLLAFSRLRPITPRTLDLEAEVGANLRMLSAMLPATVGLSLEVSGEVPPVNADPVELNQMLVNCCLNAHHAMGGRGTIAIGIRAQSGAGRVCASCHATVAQDCVEVSVRDTGTGMDAELVERIFEPFFTTKPVGEGSGMGLSMVHGVLHRLGGHVVVDSAVGEGTVFRLLLPPAVASAGDVGEDAVPEPTEERVRGRVLAVDDEPALVALYRITLEAAGCEVVTHTSAQAAWAAFEADPDRFDLVLTDLTMPELTGLELARKVRSLRPDAAVVLCSGNLESIAAEVEAVGVREVLQKPVGRSALRAALFRVLGPDAR